MDQWIKQQHVLATKMSYKNGNSLTAAQRKFQCLCKLRCDGAVPSKHMIKCWIDNFEETEPALKKSTERPSARTPQNIDIVNNSILRRPHCSICMQAAAVEMSQESVCQILDLDLKFHPYKLQVVQQLREKPLPAVISILSTNYNKHKQ